MRFHLGIGSKAKRFFLSSQPKEKTVKGEYPFGEFDFKVDSGFGYRGLDFGSKEETFFDSRAWLDSDCEDDFFSVNGEFTPSRGSTPDYQIGTTVTPQLNKSLYLDKFPDTKSEPSPTDGKKKLFHLLQETLESEHNEQNAEINGKLDDYKLKTDQPPRSSEGTPYLSGANSVCSSEMTPSRDSKHRKERTGKSKHCCFSSLVPSLSFNDRRKQKMSPRC